MIEGGIYVHVPFCKQKCAYCSFYSIESSQHLVDLYINNLIKEIDIAARQYPLHAQTLYIGGGTPSILTAAQIEYIVEYIRKYFHLSPTAEITVEANPDSLSLDKAQGLRDIGVNRISLGVQSTNDRLLAILGRLHTCQQARDAVKNLHDVGFSNINIDIMCGLPTQTLAEWEQTIRDVLELNTTHISVYPLQIEVGTKLAEQLDNQDLYVPEDDQIITMVMKAKNVLEQAGFAHYEIANYAIKGCSGKHNLQYWHLVPYIGFGPAAASYYNNVRWCNEADLSEWISNIGGNPTNVDEESTLLSTAMAEFAFLSLRLLKEGLLRNRFYDRFGVDVDMVYKSTIEELIDRGWLIDKGDRLILSTAAIPWANEVFMQFLPNND